MELFAPELLREPLTTGGPLMFECPLVPRHNRAPAVGASIVLHVLALLCLLLAEKYLPLLEPDSLDVVYTARMFPLNVSQRLYYYVERQEQPPAATRPPSAGAAGPAAPRRASLRLPPGISIPPLPEPPKSDSILIQPSADLSELLAPMPAITAWAPRERPSPKAFVQPGRARTSPERPALDAPPSLDRPNLEPRLSALNIGRLPTLRAPALQLPSSSTAPVRLLEAPKLPDQAEAAGIGQTGGDPVNLIAAGPAVLPPNTYVSVPPGVVGVPKDGGSAPSAQAGAGAGDRKDTTSGSVSKAGGAADSAVSGAGASASASGKGNIAPQPSLIELNVEARRDLPPGVKTIVRPKDGHYTFLVMGAKPEESFPEAAGLLSGQLVYTVYLRTGARPDWILQYCLPKSSEAAGTGVAGPLEAPYAYVIERPEVSFESDDERAFVHGIVDFTGKFQQLAVVGDAVIANRQILLAALNLWQFRPATRGGRPTAVEVLLIIPRPQP